MTINGWVVFGLFATVFILLGVFFAIIANKKIHAVLAVSITVIAVAILLFGMLWYFNNTANGQRLLTDQRSNFHGGIERTITVYTANGKILAQYTGKIDIEKNDGGYVKFDFDGKRYIYYNCFVETIADLE